MSACTSRPVLVVDDFKTTIKIVHGLLRQIGFTDLDEAADGATALQKMRAREFGLVISDWNMEPMTGFELLQIVRGDAALKGTPFIMITAESRPENVEAAKRAGVDNFIIKPFNAEVLTAKITSVLGPL